MPAFPWLFDGAPDRPKQEARDLLDYLETLGRDRALAGPEGEAHARNACNCSDDEKRYAFDAPVLNASPSMARRQGAFPKLAPSNDLSRGRQVYARECVGLPRRSGTRRWAGSSGLASASVQLRRAGIHGGSAGLLSVERRGGNGDAGVA